MGTRLVYNEYKIIESNYFKILKTIEQFNEMYIRISHCIGPIDFFFFKYVLIFLILYDELKINNLSIY